MRFFKRLFFAQSTKSRIAFGQISMFISVVLIAVIAGILPDIKAIKVESRVALAEAIAANGSVLITQSDLLRLESVLMLVVQRNEEVVSAGVRRADGQLVVAVANHQQVWQQGEESAPVDVQLRVPVYADRQTWGHVELRFTPVNNPGLIGFYQQPLTQFILFVATILFVLYYLYLGRMLKQLDPSQAVPDRVRSALDTMAEGLIVLDKKSQIVLANQAFSSLVKISSPALMGYEVSRLPWHKMEQEGVLAIAYPWQAALETGKAQMNQMIRLELDTGTRTFMTNCSPVLADNGKAGGVLVSFDDVTVLEEKEVELRRSKEEAEAASRAKSDFLANMSHEIRTPMNAILGFTEALRRGYGKDEKNNAHYLNTILGNGEHLLNLINDILDLSKVEAGHVDVESIPCVPHQIIKEVIQTLMVKADEKALQLSYQPEGEIPAQLLSDPARFRQIVTNLIGNAIKFTETGSVTVKTRMSQDARRLILEVVDTGIGMTEEQAATVFDPFVQADNSITRRFGGTGLGLAISKKFAAAMQGDLYARSIPGAGSQFFLELDIVSEGPISLISAEQILATSTEHQKSDSQSWHFPDARVLVVDDGAENRELVQLVLSEQGLRIDEACNGEEALVAVTACAYDIVLMDVQMPVMDGFTAVGLMRDRGFSMPVIAMTAHAMKGVEQECLAAGYSGYMSKPINIDKLLQLMVKELGAEAAIERPLTTPNTQVSAEPLPANSPVMATGFTARASGAIYSELPMQNPKFKAIVIKFIGRLNEVVSEMEASFSVFDFSQLAAQAHWLKGSAGSVGFPQFTPLALKLEQSAKVENTEGVAQRLTEIRALTQRVAIEPEEHVSQKTIASDALFIRPAQWHIPEQVTSDLLLENDRFRPIVEKFVVRLTEQLGAMDDALACDDYAALADLAHWLKGAAGSVGFNAFTELSASLENAAKAHDRAKIDELLALVKAVRNRITLEAVVA